MKAEKISIIGAGHVGSNIAFMLVLRNLCKEISLVDIRGELATGVSLDLQDARYFLKSNVSINGSDDFDSIKGSGIIVITAGKPRSPGMNREDLIKINSSIIKGIAKKVKHISPDSQVLIITNPLDLMTYVFLKESGFSSNKVIGMGSGLDSCRLANLLSEKAGVFVGDIDPFVFGAHGKDMLVSGLTSVKGLGVGNFLDKEELEQVSQDTVKRGARIVGLLKEGSARFGPAVSCLDLIESIVYDKKKVSLASVYLDGEYGLHDICLGVPVILGSCGAEKVLKINISEPENKLLKQAENTFQNQIKLV